MGGDIILPVCTLFPWNNIIHNIESVDWNICHNEHMKLTTTCNSPRQGRMLWPPFPRGISISASTAVQWQMPLSYCESWARCFILRDKCMVMRAWLGRLGNGLRCLFSLLMLFNRWQKIITLTRVSYPCSIDPGSINHPPSSKAAAMLKIILPHVKRAPPHLVYHAE